MNQYPTIFVSFRQVDGLNFTGAYDMLTWVISELYKEHHYLLDSDSIGTSDKEIAKQLEWGTGFHEGHERKLNVAYQDDAAALWKAYHSSYR